MSLITLARDDANRKWSSTMWTVMRSVTLVNVSAQLFRLQHPYRAGCGLDEAATAVELQPAVHALARRADHRGELGLREPGRGFGRFGQLQESAREPCRHIEERGVLDEL